MSFDCCGCSPGHELLFGPGRGDCASHFFKVTTHFVQVLAQGLPEGAEIKFERKTRVCGVDTVSCAKVRGCNAVLDCKSPSLILTEPGEYRLKLCGADAEDIVVTHSKVETPITANVGDTDMSCGCVDVQLIEQDNGDKFIFVDGELCQLHPNTTYEPGVDANGNPTLVGSDGTVAPITFPMGGGPGVDTNTTYTIGMGANGNPALIGSDGSIMAINIIRYTIGVDANGDPALVGSDGTEVPFNFPAGTTDTNTTYTVGIDANGDPALVGSDGTEVPFNFPAGTALQAKGGSALPANAQVLQVGDVTHELLDLDSDGVMDTVEVTACAPDGTVVVYREPLMCTCSINMVIDVDGQDLCDALLADPACIAKFGAALGV